MAQKLTLKAIQNILRGSANPVANLSVIRAKINPSDLAAIVGWLPRLRHKGVFQGQYPTRISELRRQSVLNEVSTELEFSWARHIFSSHGEKINNFLKQARTYESKLASGNYELCTEILKTIEAQCGISLWTMENRIALLQLAEGLERQKAYVSEIRAASGISVVSFIAFYLSERNEDTATPQHFVSRSTDKLDSWSLPTDIKSYLLFRLTNRLPESSEELAHILRFEAVSSIIDYYDTFIRLTQQVIFGEANSLKARVIAELKRLSSLIDDDRITKLLFLAGLPSELEANHAKVNLDVAEAHLNKQFKEACDLATDLRAVEDANFNEWITEAEARSEAKLLIDPSDRVFASRIIRMLTSLLSKDDETASSVLSLSRIALNFRLLRFSPQIESFLHEENSSDPNIKSRLALKSFVNNHYLDPRGIRSLSESEHRNSYAQTVLKIYGRRDSVVLPLLEQGMGEFLSDTGIKIDGTPRQTEAQKIGRVRNLVTTRDYSVALAEIGPLSKSESIRSRRIAKRFEGYCLIKLGRLDDAIQFTVSEYLADRGIINFLPLKESVQLLDTSSLDRLADQLSTPILLDLYCRFISDDIHHLRANAYEDFLFRNGIERPSQLLAMESSFKREELLYYLRFICVPSVMNISIAFASTKDLEDERLAVNLDLSKLDPNNASVYEAEIREITRNQIIQQCVRQVEQSKIFVDAAALKRWAELNLRESFNRYQALKKVGIGVSHTDLVNMMQDLRAGRPIPREFLELPKNEAVDLLVQMVRSLLNECTGNPEYGLDCYLSIRIRHGTLSGQLRHPLEVEKLITQRNSDLPSYQSNQYWVSRLAGIEWYQLREIDLRLAKFSQDYDLFVERFAKELIQIHGENKKDGLFVVTMGVVQIRLLAAQVKDDTTFGAFIDQFFELFWESIQRCLDKICLVIDSSLKTEVSQLFAQLESDISTMADATTLADLNRAIRTARTSALHALDKVKGWFQLSQPLTAPELSFDALVDIGLQSVKNIHSDFLPHLEKHLPDIPHIRGGLNLFSDIFFIIFDNIRRHSAIRSGEPKVKISVENFGDRLSVIVKNELGAEADVIEIKAKVNKIRQAIQDGAYQDIIRSEGGTGFSKLWKLINSEVNQRKSLDFGISEDGWFFVQFDVPVVLSTEFETRKDSTEEVPA